MPPHHRSGQSSRSRATSAQNARSAVESRTVGSHTSGSGHRCRRGGPTRAPAWGSFAEALHLNRRREPTTPPHPVALLPYKQPPSQATARPDWPAEAAPPADERRCHRRSSQRCGSGRGGRRKPHSHLRRALPRKHMRPGHRGGIGRESCRVHSPAQKAPQVAAVLPQTLAKAEAAEANAVRWRAVALEAVGLAALARRLSDRAGNTRADAVAAKVAASPRLSQCRNAPGRPDASAPAWGEPSGRAKF